MAKKVKEEKIRVEIQEQYAPLFNMPEVRYKLYYGGRSGGKSYVFVNVEGVVIGLAFFEHDLIDFLLICRLGEHCENECGDREEGTDGIDRETQCEGIRTGIIGHNGTENQGQYCQYNA